MKEILFILLIVTVTTLDNFELPEWQHTVEMFPHISRIDDEITDEWSTTRWHGDLASAGRAHYKAILFHSRAALDRYLATKKLPGEAVLLDAKTGRHLSVTQTPIIESQVKTEKVVRGYRASVREGKP